MYICLCNSPKFDLMQVRVASYFIIAQAPKAALSCLAPEQREKEEAARVQRQRPVLRVRAELAC